MRVFLLTGTLSALIGCAIPEEESFEYSVLPLFESQCIGCHNPNLPEGGLDLQTDPYAVLLDTPSNQSTLPFVSPGSNLHSYLWHKMNGSQAIAGGAGTSMPLGASTLEDALLTVEFWINTGAQP